jgi:integrase
MPRRPSFEVSCPKEGVFLVHVPASLSMLGKLERRTFKDGKDAEKFAAKLRTQYHKGIRGGVVDAATAHNASAAEKAIKDAGLNITVIEAVRTYIEARAMLDPIGSTIAEVSKTWVKKFKARGDDRTFREASAAFIKEKEMDWSDRYVRNIQQTTKALPDWFMDLKLPEIDEVMMMKATKESVTTQTAIETRMRHIKSLCSGKGRKKAKRGVALLTVGQCAAMLRACATPDERRAVALLLFAGIRPDAQDGEFSKLEWSAIKDGKITISADVSKTGTDRIIPIRPRLARLIKGHPKDGKILPVGWAKRIQAIRKAAGMNDPKFQDATRHAFASHHLVAYGEASTQAAMGHTEGSRTLFKHYRAAVTEDAGKKYFQ